jgi:serine protease Do
VVSSDGFIVTNEHVVENNEEVNVKFNNGFSLKGRVIKKNAAADLALIKVDAADLTALNMVTDEAEIGEDVFAIGTPGDISLEQTVSKGIISGRRVIDGLKFLQTDVSINPGNSGGPLINSNGQILGITSMKIVARGFEGLGFAIPSADVMKMLNLTVK